MQSRLGVILVAGLFVLCARANATETSPRQPNIVFAFADDLGRYASAYADPARPSPNDLIRTPHFDRVAREGALFDHAFVSAPSCTPSRAAIISGRHFFRNGSHSQLHHPWVVGYPDPWDEVKGFALMLQGAGYHIGWTWKMHISEDRMGGLQRNYRSAGSRFNQFSQNATKAKDPQAEKLVLLEEVRGNFRAFLADRKDGQPFYYWFNPTQTHRKWTRGSGKALWGLDPDQLKGKLPPFLPDSEVIREDFADYLGEAMAFDAAVGILLQELERIGELDNTLVVVSGDHGAPGFPRGKCNLYDFGTEVLLAMRWPARIAAGRRIGSPVSLIDLAPTYLTAAGLEPAPDMNGQNLLPALAEGAHAPETLLRGSAIFGREVHVGQAREGYLPYSMRGLRTGDFLYLMNLTPDRWPMGDPKAVTEDSTPSFTEMENQTYVCFADIDASPTKAWMVEQRDDPAWAVPWALGFGKREREELYDLRKDPHQMRNVANDPQYAEIQQQLRQQLEQVLRDNGDPRLRDNAFDRPPYVKPAK
jgi:uncharacterized sulfatase